MVAFRSSHSLGYFLTFYLHLILQNTELIDNSDTMFERLAGLEEEDLLIGIGFPRYTPRTLQALQFSRTRGVPTLAITDSGASPWAGKQICVYSPPAGCRPYVDSFTAPLSLVNGLLTAVGQTVKDQASQRLAKMENCGKGKESITPGENNHPKQRKDITLPLFFIDMIY